ncbi:MAG: lipid-A-disaccharide synthase [Acidobacteriia bacterium]|nr:lipid-A-disaccharide synthase [Terriglobia bacterium]
MRILISAGEASGDLYASRVVELIRARNPEAQFFGCAGPRMQAAGVRPIVDARSLAVAGLVEVVEHIPRIWGEFRKLVRAAAMEKPDLAVLTDSPDFHLRLAKRLKRQGIPVIYLIAPQVWAWREWRVRAMRRDLKRLLCIFPFEQEFFERHGVPVTYIGHPLARIVQPSMSAAEFRSRFQIPDQPIVTLLPGSRHGEAERHMPVLLDAVARIGPAYSYVLALPLGFDAHKAKFWERIRGSSIKVIEGSSWDALAHAELALAASGTVTMEAAILGVPMVTFYRVNALSWLLGRRLVRAPFLSMVNLVAGREIVPELIQQEMTGQRIADEAVRILKNADVRESMRADLGEVARKLASDRDPMEIAAEWIEKVFSESQEIVHAR